MKSKQALLKDLKDNYFDERDVIVRAKEELELKAKWLCDNLGGHRYEQALNNLTDTEVIIDDLKLLLSINLNGMK